MLKKSPLYLELATCPIMIFNNIIKIYVPFNNLLSVKIAVQFPLLICYPQIFSELSYNIILTCSMVLILGGTKTEGNNI